MPPPSLSATGDASATASSGPPEAEIQRLVQRAGQGDAEAFGKLYDIYLDRIYRYVYYRVGRAADAEDLTEEIFLKAWEAIAAYRSRGAPFGAWLFRLARNHVIDHARTLHPTLPLLEVLPSRDDAVSETVARALDAAALRRRLWQLTEEQREVIVLKFLDGLGTKEIAAVTGRQEGAVRALVMRALQALRELMRDEEYAR